MTKRQRQILDLINAYYDEYGYAPTLQEIADTFGLSSLATVHEHLRNLEAQGLIVRKNNEWRGIETYESRMHQLRTLARQFGEEFLSAASLAYTDVNTP